MSWPNGLKDSGVMGMACSLMGEGDVAAWQVVEGWRDIRLMSGGWGRLQLDDMNDEL